MDMIAVNDLTKVFKLGQMVTIKQNVANVFNFLRGLPAEKPRQFKALDGVTFSIESGEVVGMIGSNGAGKSTLLKILAGVTRQSSGRVNVAGKVAPLIEVGAGLHPELTGRENILLNAAILGVPPREIRALTDPILDFAEIVPFADTPVKKYSSGMKVRLGFSIATSIDADILIVDEVLAVGDIAFQRKCFDRMEELIMKQKKTVLLVSHNIRHIQRICTRTMLFEQGKLLADGPTEDVCKTFFEKSDEKIYSVISRNKAAIKSANGFELLSLSLSTPSGDNVKSLTTNEPVDVRIRYRTHSPLVKPRFGIGVHTSDFLYLTTYDSRHEIEMGELAPGAHEAVLSIARLPFTPGVYSLRLGVSGGLVERTIFSEENLLNFRVTGEERFRNVSGSEGLLLLDAEWKRLS